MSPSPHEKQLIDDLSEMRRARNLAEIAALNWMQRARSDAGPYIRARREHAISNFNLAERDVDSLEQKLLKESHQS